MKIYIDFSILLLNAGAYGNVTGTIEANNLPKIGDAIELLDAELTMRHNIPNMLIVQSVTEVPGYDVSKSVVGLQDIVVSSKEAAKELSSILESESGLFCVEY